MKVHASASSHACGRQRACTDVTTCRQSINAICQGPCTNKCSLAHVHVRMCMLYACNPKQALRVSQCFATTCAASCCCSWEGASRCTPLPDMKMTAPPGALLMLVRSSTSCVATKKCCGLPSPGQQGCHGSGYGLTGQATGLSAGWTTAANDWTTHPPPFSPTVCTISVACCAQMLLP